MGGTFRNCLFQQNAAINGGGTSAAVLEGCTIVENEAARGGGADTCSLTRCDLRRKWAGLGSAVYSVILTSCLVADHPHSTRTLNYSLLHDSTVVVENADRLDLLGADNCLLYYTDGPSATGSIFESTPLPLPTLGTMEFRIDPGFVDATHGDYHLRFDSPAVNAGPTREEPATDLDGNPRVVGAKQDLGAYEVQGFDLPTYEDWLHFFLLPDGGVADTDGDGFANIDEWRAGTDPTNPLAAPKLKVSVTSANELVLGSTATLNRAYVLEETPRLEDGISFREVLSGIWNTTHTVAFVQWTNEINPRSRFTVSV